MESNVGQRRKLFFRIIFGRNTGYVCIAFLGIKQGDKKAKFHEEFFRYPEEEEHIQRAIEEHLDSHNVYFCPHLFSDKKRDKGHVSCTPSAWADLDYCAPNKMLVEPSVTLKTSDKRFQALWVFADEVDPDDAEDLSRRIAYKHAEDGADRSGWDLTQLLRVPFTYNLKYPGEPPVVEIVAANDNKYALQEFEDYPQSPSYAKVEIPMPTELLENQQSDIGNQILESYRFKLNPTIWRLYSETPEGTSWSEVLWKMLLMCFEGGMDSTQVYYVAREAACNKFARDGKPALLLWKEVCRAEGRYELNQRLAVPKPEELVPLLSEEETARVEAADETFVERYIKWASSLGDAAPQYHQAGAFIVLSSLLAGNVQLPTSYGTVIPNIWFMILADTTLTRKTTAMDIAMDLVMEIDQDVIMATDGSLEGLLSSLAARPGRPSVFLRDEFSGLLEQMTKKDYMAGMAELLTKLYDGKFQKRVLRKEIVEVREPRLIVFAGGIKNRVTGSLNFDMVSSGFMPRFVFLTAESDLSRVRPIGPPTVRTTGDRDKIMEELTDIAKHYHKTQTLKIEKLNASLTEPYKFQAQLTQEAWIRYNLLENQMLQNGLRNERPEVMTPVGDRLAKSILKAALLLATSRQRSEDILVEELDVLIAIKYGQQWAAHALDIMDNVGKGIAERQLDNIARTIAKNPGGMPRSNIMQSYHLTARDTNALFDTLEQRGLIRRVKQGRTEMLIPTVRGTEMYVEQQRRKG